MMRARVFAWTFASVLSASDLAPAQEPTAGEESLLAQGSSNFDPELPAELEVTRAPTGHLLVRPKIDGEELGWFIFDTGAGICVVSTAHAEKLGPKASGTVNALGGGGSATQSMYRAETLELGPITLHDHPIMATDLAFLTPFLGDEIAGVIGYGVLSKCVAEIRVGDEERKPRIALYDPALYELEEAEWGELVLHKRIPAVRASFEDREGLFHIDTGANGCVTFNQPAVETWKLLEGREVSDAQLGGVGGFVAAKKGKVAWFELGGLRRENVTATFAVESKGNHADSSLAGSIGSELLAPFTLVLDYGKKRIAFVRNGP